MPYERGQWRYIGTGGYGPQNQPNRDNFKENEKSHKKSIVCPLCGKEQPKTRMTCFRCDYDFYNKNQALEHFISEVKKQKCDIHINKIKQYSKNNYFSAPYYVRDDVSAINQYMKLINPKSGDNKILFVSKNKTIIDNLKKRLSENKSNIILKLSNDAEHNLNSLTKSIEKFHTIINSSKYSLKKFIDVDFSKNISDLRYLADVRYINDKDSEVLNDFLKVYWKYWESTQSSEFDLEFENKNLEKEISNQTKKLINLKKSISWFNNRIEKLTGLYDLFGVNYNQVTDKLELMDTILILKESPYIIDSKEKEEFLNLMNNYQNQNYDMPVSVLIQNFDDDDISQILEGYTKYCDKDNDIHQINQSISELKNQFKAFGFKFNKLNDYYFLKDDIARFSNSIYLDGNGYLLSNKLDDFVKNYADSFKRLIFKGKINLLNYLSQNNKLDIKGFGELNNKIIQINSILADIGISSNEINDIKELESFCNFNSEYENDYDVIPLLSVLTSNFDSQRTLNDYSRDLQFQFKEVMLNIFSNADYDLNKGFELEYIQYNISIIKNLIKKMGLSVKSISEINNEFDSIYKLSDYSIISEGTESNYLNDLNMDNNLFSEATLIYLKENNRSQILNDLNILNISIQSILYEFDNNQDYLYLDDLLDGRDTQDSNANNESLELMNKIKIFFKEDDFINIMENYSEIFEYSYDLIEKSNLNHFKVKLDDLKNKFDEIYRVYELCSDKYLNELANNTHKFLTDLKESESNYLKLMELYDNGFLNAKTINLIKNNQFERYFNELNILFESIDLTLIKNDLTHLDLDELSNITNDISTNDLKSQKDFEELYSRIDRINTTNFYEVISDVKSYSVIEQSPQFNSILRDYETINDILILYSNLKFDYCEKLTDLSYDELKSFLEFLKVSKEFTAYVNQGIIDKDNFVDFSDEIENIDLKINSIEKQLFDLNLSQDVLENFSHIQIKNSRKIKRKLNKIDNNKVRDSYDVNKCMKKNKLIVNELYSLCINQPIELKSDNGTFKSGDYISSLLSLKAKLKNYEKLLEMENKILSFDEIINKNLLNYWEGFFTDLNVIKDKFEIDEKFTELFNKGIFTNKTLENLNSFSDDHLSFVNEFRKTMDDDELKSNYILVYNHQEILLNEINNLQEYDKTNLIGYKKSFDKVNIIFKNSQIDECIHLLDYFINKEDKTEIIDEYYGELRNNYSLIYNKYFDKTEFDFTMDEVLNKLKLHLKCTDLINNKIIQQADFNQIKANKTNFLKEIEMLETLRLDILTKIDHVSENFIGIESISKWDLVAIEKLKNNLEKANIYLTDDDFIKDNFKDYLSYFDYVICDDSSISEEMKYYSFLTSKSRLSIVKIGEE